ncbi:MAG TPA: hypothetical protein VFI47_30520 [Acidimicrobiales bacterium]|nr:hypothetical protein [Acidimicrobiales bacterium]
MIARRAATAVLAAAAAAGLAAGCAAPPADLDTGPVDRVLVVSLPGVAWDDVQAADLPHLDRFVEHAAIADMATRIGRRSAGSTDAYLTLGAGTRAVAPVVDMAVAVDPDETYGGVPAAELVGRRLGEVPDGPAYLAIGPAIDANDRSAFGAEVGMLGERLATAGVDRAVVANADAVEGFVSEDPPPDGAYARSAATMLMDADGVVPQGTVSRSLLADDPAAAFGWRLDREKVVDAVDQVWDGGGRRVVLVEASDLSRVAAYGSRADAAQRRALREQALTEADALLGELLERVDPARDAVVVLSPVAPAASPALGIAAVQAPGVDGGLLQSATTRRAGYVQLADVAPTVLTLLGERAPDDIEGRSFAVGDPDARDRVTGLADAAEAAAFRDGTMVLVVVGITAVLVLAAAGTLLQDRLPDRLRRWLTPLNYGALGFVPATFLVGQVDAVRADLVGQVAAIVAVAALVAMAVGRIDRARPGSGPLVAVGATVALVAVDALAGGPLQLNTTFGYSVAVAGRFTGLGNLAFALLGAATILLAALIADRYGRRGLPAAFGVLGAVVVVEGLPMVGADVGGVLSMVPAFGMTALILAGRRVGWREVAGLAATTAVVVFAFALVDAARPPEVQTHLARLADHVLGARWDLLSKTLGRRWEASLGGAELAGWITVGAVTAVAAAYAVLVEQGRAGPRAVRPLAHRPTRAAAAGLAVLGVVGVVANDSSVAVPFTMLIVVAPVVMLRALAERPGPRRPPAAPAGAGDGSARGEGEPAVARVPAVAPR